MTIDFEEAVFGAKKEISIRKDVKCHTCNGEGAKPGTSKKHVVTVRDQAVLLLNKILYLVV